MLKLFISGQKSFGADIYKADRLAGHTVTGAECPAGTHSYDRLTKATYCPRPVIVDAEQLRASDIPDGTDVIIAAHSRHLSARSPVQKSNTRSVIIRLFCLSIADGMP